MSPRPRGNEQPNNLQERILATAWKQIAEFGAPALSLRAIARELKITAPAIYNYFARRDDLVTALVIAAYADFGDAQMAALQAAPADDPVGRLLAVGVAYRQWALNYPERYLLIFGAPIPGYFAPIEKIMPTSARSLAGLVSVLETLRLQGKLRLSPALCVDPDKLAQFETWKKMGVEADIQSFSAAVLIWARVHGLVSLEISNSLPPCGPSPDMLYKYELEAIAKEFIQ